MATLLSDAKLSLRLTDSTYDGEILRLLNVGAKELGFADVIVGEITSSTAPLDPLTEDALILFVEHRFWGNDEGSKKCFDVIRAEMQTGRRNETSDIY